MSSTPSGKKFSLLFEGFVSFRLRSGVELASNIAFIRLIYRINRPTKPENRNLEQSLQMPKPSIRGIDLVPGSLQEVLLLEGYDTWSSRCQLGITYIVVAADGVKETLPKGVLVNYSQVSDIHRQPEGSVVN